MEIDCYFPGRAKEIIDSNMVTVTGYEFDLFPKMENKTE